MGKTAVNFTQFEEQVREWVTSSRGKKTIEKTIERSKKTTKQLQKNRRIDPGSLDKPFTV